MDKLRRWADDCCEAGLACEGSLPAPARGYDPADPVTHLRTLLESVAEEGVPLRLRQMLAAARLRAGDVIARPTNSKPC